MYNETYIRDFHESQYLTSLSDYNRLLSLKQSALDLYTDNSNAESLAYRESLDHYVAKRLSTDPSFIDSKEFQNYIAYSLRLVNERSLRATNEYVVYPELLTNPVFRNDELRKKIFDKYLTPEQRAGYERHRINTKKVIGLVFDEMRQHHRLTPDLINIAADYIYTSKDTEDGKGEIFASYILNHAEALKLKSTPAIAGALTTICASKFTLDPEVKNSRFFIANFDGAKRTHLAHSSGRYKYCVFSKDTIDSLSLTSCDSLFKSRSMKNKDVYWLLFVSFHELTHQHQGLDHERGRFTTSGISRAINRVLNKYMPRSKLDERTICDYDANHDSDETEMEADEEGWRQTRKFIHELVSRKNRMFTDAQGVEHDKWIMAWDNEKAVRVRRAFTVKKTAETMVREKGMDPSKKSKGLYYALYDLINLDKIVRANPEAVKGDPILGKLFHSDGRMRVIDILSTNLYRNPDRDQLTWNTSNNAGLEIGSYVLTHKWDEVRGAIDRGEIHSKKQATQIGRNMYDIIHENVLKVRDFDKIAQEGRPKKKYDGIDIEQYDETRAKFDLRDREMSKQLHEYYFRSVCTGVRRFYEYKALMKSKYNVDIEDDGLYLIGYVVELYNGLEDKDDPSCMEALAKFKETGDPTLVDIHDRIMTHKEEVARRRLQETQEIGNQDRGDNSSGRKR